MLARAVLAAGDTAKHDMIALDRAALDVTNAAAVRSALRACAPDAVVHCAAYTRVDDAEAEARDAMAVNAVATSYLADAADECGAALVYPSSDYVFDGRTTSPYSPDDAVAPLSAYGQSKLAGEREAGRAARHYIVRTSWLYGAHGRNFVSTMLRLARAGQPLRVVGDQRGSPTWTADLAAMMLALLERGAPSGTWHATNAGDTTWFGFARAIFDEAGIDADLSETTSTDYAQRATRPRYSVLDCTATYAITGQARHWRDALRAALPELS